MKKLLAILLAICAYGQDIEIPCCTWDDCSNSRYLYANVMSGPNWVPSFELDGIDNTLKTGYIVSASLGYCWWYGMRLEAEYAYRRNAIKTIGFFGSSFSIPGDYQSNSYMANFLWDMPLDRWLCKCWGLKPTIGAGIGYDNQHINGDLGILTYHLKKKAFAWQAIAGFAYSIIPCIDLSLEYRCHKGGFHNLYNHALGVSLNYHFYCR